jgi:hypothetical protein
MADEVAISSVYQNKWHIGVVFEQSHLALVIPLQLN